MTKSIEGPKQINCSSCNSEIDLTNTEWTIGWYKNMKTKKVVCKCGCHNNISISVKNKDNFLTKIAGRFK